MRTRLGSILAAMLVVSACSMRTPEPTPTPTDTPTPRPTPTPSVTPTPTRVPNCPAPDPNAAWIAPVDYGGYPEAIGNYLNAGGSPAALRTILTNASSIDAQFGGVWPYDLTGDGDPETLVSIYDPASRPVDLVPNGMLLIYGCADRTAPLLHQDTGWPMLQVKRVDDFVGAGRGAQVATIRSECGAHTCFDTLDVLGWDGTRFVSLMGDRLQMPYPQYTFANLDADPAQEIQAVSGQIASVGAGPQRTITETWDWNGAQFAKVGQIVSPPEYRIHAVHDADDFLTNPDFLPTLGNITGVTDLYQRVITDDTLKDWQVEIGMEKPTDRANLTAYAWYRIMIANARFGDVASAQAAFDRLSADFPSGAPGHAYRQLAQVFWTKYQETNDLVAACLAANVHANDNADVLDGLNAFGYANRQYVAADMCPFTGP